MDNLQPIASFRYTHYTDIRRYVANAKSVTGCGRVGYTFGGNEFNLATLPSPDYNTHTDTAVTCDDSVNFANLLFTHTVTTAYR